MPKKIDLIGQTFGRLTVIQEDNTRSGGHVKWLCKCNYLLIRFCQIEQII